ncbi:MAG: hypothetical protein ABH823_02590 [bacterium]
MVNIGCRLYISNAGNLNVRVTRFSVPREEGQGHKSVEIAGSEFKIGDVLRPESFERHARIFEIGNWTNMVIPEAHLNPEFVDEFCDQISETIDALVLHVATLELSFAAVTDDFDVVALAQADLGVELVAGPVFTNPLTK